MEKSELYTITEMRLLLLVLARALTGQRLDDLAQHEQRLVDADRLLQQHTRRARQRRTFGTRQVHQYQLACQTRMQTGL